jgi:hypothetical protein
MGIASLQPRRAQRVLRAGLLRSLSLLAMTFSETPTPILAAPRRRSSACRAAALCRRNCISECGPNPVRRGRGMIDLLAVEAPKPKPAKIRAVSYETAIDQLFKRMRSSRSALTQQAVSNPRRPVPNERHWSVRCCPSSCLPPVVHLTFRVLGLP